MPSKPISFNNIAISFDCFAFFNVSHSWYIKLFTSLPSGIPLPKVAVKPITFATSVLIVRNSSNATPLNIVLTSGTPDPAIQRHGKCQR